MYKIYIGVVSGNYDYLISIANTTFTITGISQGTIYYFVVTAVNTFGESSYSNEKMAIPYGAVCSSLNSDYIFITAAASPTPGSVLTTSTSYTFKITSCLTLTAPTGYVLLTLFTQGSSVATISQTVSGGNQSLTLSINYSFSPGGSYILAEVDLLDDLGLIKAQDAVTYTIDDANYLGFMGSTPSDATLINTGFNYFSFTVQYKFSGSYTIWLFLTKVCHC